MKAGTIKICCSLSMLMFLSGCVNVATTSASAVYNRQSMQKSWKDQYTTMRIYQSMNYKTDKFKSANISIATQNGEVLLAGQAPERWQREEAEKIAKATPDVKHVYNLVTIASPSSPLTKVSDAWITSKVKAKLLASEDLDATQIKVVTEDGNVYLMGIVKPEEADAAVELASNTDGVQKVVKVFSYIIITKNVRSLS